MHEHHSDQRWPWDNLLQRFPFFPYLLILLIVYAAVIGTNFPKIGTWLTGWDNLHPEFDLAVNIKRALFGVWQSHQGLGHVGGHGYAATLLHSLTIGILSLVFPDNLLRYTFTFLILGTGAIGSFFLIRYILRAEENRFRHLASLSGSLYYLLNFGTVQNFYAPLEAFTVHFGFLPWLLLTLFQFLDQPTKRTLLWFSLVTLLSTPQGFIPPVFLVYGVTLGLILVFFVAFKRTWTSLRTAILAGIVTLCINAFWLFPVIHYTIRDSKTYLSSYNNLSSTQGFLDKNHVYGNLRDLPLIRGFFYESVDTNENGETTRIFAPWYGHFAQTFPEIAGYALFGIVILGMLIWTVKKRSHYRFSLIVIAAFTFIALAGGVPGLAGLSRFLEEIPILKQAFRAGFTKLSILLALSYSVFLAVGTLPLIRIVLHRRLRPELVTAASIFLLGIFSWPIFTGHFLYQKITTQIPAAYQELFTFFATEPANGRIANIPMGDNWGWSTYRWGYSGSGFLWYGIRQPILDRAFDTWSHENENYYWEMSYALFSGNQELFDNTLKKYAVRWVLFDESVVPYNSTKASIYSDKQKNLLASSSLLRLVKTFPIDAARKESLYLYAVDNTSDNTPLTLVTNLPEVNPYSWTNVDQAFADLGNYAVRSTPTVIYPFRTLFTGRPTEQEFSLLDEGDRLVFQRDIDLPSSPSMNLIIPPYSGTDVPQFDTKDNRKIQFALPTISLDETAIATLTAQPKPTAISLEQKRNVTLSVSIPKITGELRYDSRSSDLTSQYKTCDSKRTGPNDHSKETIGDTSWEILTNENSSGCIDIFIPPLSHRYSYLVSIQSLYEKGNSLRVSLINGSSGRTDQAIDLPRIPGVPTRSFLVIPPMEPDGLGYSLRFENNSVGKRTAKNRLGPVTIDPIPFSLLMGIRLGTVSQALATSTPIPTVSHPNPSFYEAQVPEVQSPSTLVLSESFHSGWRAYIINAQCQVLNAQCALFKLLPFVFGTPIKEHILVNNWANGWTLQSDQLNQSTNPTNNKQPTIIIFFLPQLLQWVGFALLPLPFLFALWPRRKRLTAGPPEPLY